MKNLLDIRIETERLVMKPVAFKYAKDIFPEFSDEITIFMYPSTPKTVSDTENYIKKSREEMKQGKDFSLSIFLKSSSEFLGGAGIHDIEGRTPELGIWIKKSAHGNKYGQEAVFELKKWAEENLDYEYLLYPVAKENIASRKIAESLGGKIAREFIGEKENGEKMEEVEYRIYR